MPNKPPERPTAFWAELGGEKELLVLKRVGDVVIEPDEKAIQGTWQVESSSMLLVGKDLTVRIRDGSIESRGLQGLGGLGGGGVGVGGLGRGTGGVSPAGADYQPFASCVINPQAQPKTIDLIAPMNNILTGIYRLEGDRLTLCLTTRPQLGMATPQDRPANFDVPPDGNTGRIVLRRVPERAGGTGVSPVQSDTGKTPVLPPAVPLEKAIQGTWQVVSSTRFLFPLNSGGWDGTGKAEDAVKTTQVTITADTLKFLGPHVISAVYQYQLNTDSSPPMIDVQGPDVEYGEIRLGIVRLQGDELKLCFGSPAQSSRTSTKPGKPPDRPSELWAEMGSLKELLVLKRVGDVVIDPDEKAIQGTWQVENNSMELVLDWKAVLERAKEGVGSRGRRPGSEENPVWGAQWAAGLPKGQTVQIKDRQIVWPRVSDSATAGASIVSVDVPFAINPHRQPKAIDTLRGFPDPLYSVGIYRLEGDRLTLCLKKMYNQPAGIQRPASFDVPPDKVNARIVLRRVPESGKPPAGETASRPGPVATPSAPPSKAKVDKPPRQEEKGAVAAPK
jgi:uncharacterized protein (TIGR03067 family)